MSLHAGTSFGPYEILAPIGAGGMGEVYRARDTKLKRDVALKVLPEIFAADPGRLSRFQREAEVLASLNHPNIAHIYGVEERALAMELVEGDSPRGPMPFDDAWKIASQIADALEYAHDKGIVHRDLKPANVRVTPEGTVKLLDFGLAKAFNDLSDAPSSDPSNSPTLSLGATSAGAIVGTAGYMAPEQAKGKAVDRRADIWAWGVLFYELLTGQRLFEGEDASEILAQVLTKQPDFERVPMKARHLLRECLQKDPRQRLRDIGDAKRMIANDVAPASAIQTSSRVRLLPWLVSAAAIIIAAVAILSSMRPLPQREPGIIRFARAARVTQVGAGLIAISRDGSRIAFVGGTQRQIYFLAIDQFEARPLAGTEGSSSLSFSPNGEWISYVSGYPGPAVIKKVAVASGPPQTITSAPAVQITPTQSWGMDDNIYFSTDAGLQRIASAGGKPEIVATPDSKAGERVYVGPELLPDGRHILVNTLKLERGPAAHRLLILDLLNHEKKVLLEDTGAPPYALSIGKTGAHLLYYDGPSGSIMAAPVDLSHLTVRGSAVPVQEDVLSTGPNGVGQFAVSPFGTLAYVPRTALEEASRTLVWVDRQGTEETASCPSPRQYNLPRLSPDNDRVAVEIQNPGGVRDVWICDLTRGSLSKITSGNSYVRPIWAGRERVIYSSAGTLGGGEVMSAPFDGGPPQVLATADFMAYSVFPDGKTLIGMSSLSAALGRTVSILPTENLSTTGTKTQPVDLAFPGTDPQFSPDGKFIAYGSIETGRSEIYVRAYPGPGGKTTISTEGGGLTPRWSRSGELFYLSGGKLMAVAVQTAPAFHAGKPKVLFQNTYANGYDVTSDGKRFLMVKSNGLPPPARPEQLNVVMNWFEELRRRVPVK
jgi:serine/threonine protein kinase/Tol biopolymer transport system component